jgi:outer membrane protein assembly factor BamA
LLADSAGQRVNQERTGQDTTGRFVQISRVFIIGNRITRDRIVLRELTLKSGDMIYNEDLPAILEQDKKKLLNTRLFNTVEIRPLELEVNKIDLLIELNERWYTFPSPIFELSDRNFNEWWENYDHDFRRVNYGLRLYQFNMRGRNERLRFTAQFGFTRKFELSYRIPSIDKKQKHGLEIDLDYSETKNLAYRTLDHKLQFLRSENILKNTKGIGLTYTYRNSFYDFHGVKLEYRQTEVNDTIPELNSNFFNNEEIRQRYGAISYWFTSDHRDIIAYPLTGHYFNLNIIKTGLGFSEDINKIEGNASYARYLNLKKGFYLTNLTHVFASAPDDVPYSNYGVLGYKRLFVRGYEVYVIEGPFYTLNKTTFKKRIFSNVYHWNDMPIEQFRHIPIAIYFKTYADLGYVKNYPNYSINSTLSDKLLAGIGGGLDLVSSYDTVLRFEYTINAEGQHGFFFHIKKEF